MGSPQKRGTNLGPTWADAPTIYPTDTYLPGLLPGTKIQSSVTQHRPPTSSPVGRPLETALLRVKSGQGAQEWRAGLYLGGRRGRPGSREGRVAGGQTAGPDPEGLPGAEGFSLRFHKDQPRPRDTK